jgi:hypothetical protein
VPLPVPSPKQQNIVKPNLKFKNPERISSYTYDPNQKGRELK